MTSQLLVQLLLGGFGVTGLVGAGVALYKLRPEVNSAAVTDAQGAMKSMRDLNDELKERMAELRQENAEIRDERDTAIRERDDALTQLGRAQTLLRLHDLL